MTLYIAYVILEHSIYKLPKMTTEILNSLNWIDILMGVILVRVVFIGVKRGVVIELFKFVGVFFALFITLHYFSGTSKFFQDKVHLPESAGDLFSFILLWGLVTFVFKLIRDGFELLIKMEAAHSAFDKWGGLVLSMIRGLLIGSLTVLCLRVTGMEYFTKNLEKSLTGVKLASISPQLYEATYNNFVSKFFPSEELNKSVFKLADFEKKEKEKK